MAEERERFELLYLFMEKDGKDRTEDEYIEFDGCAKEDILVLAGKVKQRTICHVLDDKGDILATRDTRKQERSDA